jgi:glucose 1-dehydrogenase/3-oxoacyl-[acyl-carrier protein] reductase
MSSDARVVLVTGAGRGVGRGIALEFGRAGAHVVVHYLEEHEQAQELCALLGRGATCIQADISRTEDRDRMFSRIAGEFGRLDVLVNNAGFDPGTRHFLDLNESEYEQVLGVNVRGTLFCAQAAAQMMIDAAIPGRIINISSIHSHLTTPGRTAYATSKGAIDAMTRALAIDLAAYAITVNSIAPGFIEVERTIDAMPGYDRAVVGSSIPAGRVGLPCDVGALAVFLASSQASFITGQIIGCDGGSSVKLGIVH